MILLSFLFLLYISAKCQERNFKCSQNDPTPSLSVPLNALIQVNRNVYLVNQERKHKVFVINCTSYQPVEWRFEGSIGNTVVRSVRSISYDWYDSNKGFSGSCYYSALIFDAVEDEITGQYICAANPKIGLNAPSPTGPLSKIVLFSGLSAMTYRNNESSPLKYELNWLIILIKYQKYDNNLYPYKLPCARNHPDATLSLFYTEDIENQEPRWVEDSFSFNEEPAVSITIQLSKIQLPRTYKCTAKIRNSNYSSEHLFIQIPSYPVSFHHPVLRDVIYTLPSTYFCLSHVPVQIVKNDKLPTYLQSKKDSRVDEIYRKLGIDYISAFEVLTDSTSASTTDTDQIGSITCEDIQTKGNLTSWTWNYNITHGFRHVLIGEPRNRLNGRLRRAECKTTVTAKDAHVRYIQASTHAELSLQQSCLSLPFYEWNICNHRNQDLQTAQDEKDLAVAYADIPRGISGAFQCVIPDDSPTSVNFTTIFSETIFNELGGDRNDDQDFMNFSISGQYHTIHIGDTIETTCVSSRMFFYGPGIWVIIWTNSSKTSVPSSWITMDNLTRSNTYNLRNSKIVVDSLDAIGITCGAVPTKYINERHIHLVYPSPQYMSVHVKEKKPILATNDIALIMLCVVIVLVVIALGFGFWWIRRQNFEKVDKMYENILQNFFHGFEPKVKDEKNLCETAESKPYDRSYEIPKEELNVDWNSPLGSGAFGLVLNGNYSKRSTEERDIHLKKVAVKTLKENADHSYLMALMSELKVMIYIGKHSNLVALIGANTEKLAQRELYVILEYCKNGSLQRYLQKHRTSFTNNLPGASDHDMKKLYPNAVFTQYELTTVDLFRWSRQIISGMQYLVDKKVIHGDLATRNILLDDFFVAKVSDFGLSRRLYEQYEYVKKSQEPLPWRWMAIESLRDLTFSSETDVWSFGITLWEIFSLAETPYIGDIYSSEFIKMLKNDYRLSIPQYAPHQMYNIMTHCWHTEPDQRPKFHDLAETFDTMLDVAVTDSKNPSNSPSSYIDVVE